MSSPRRLGSAANGTRCSNAGRRRLESRRACWIAWPRRSWRRRPSEQCYFSSPYQSSVECSCEAIRLLPSRASRAYGCSRNGYGQQHPSRMSLRRRASKSRFTISRSWQTRGMSEVQTFGRSRYGERSCQRRRAIAFACLLGVTLGYDRVPVSPAASRSRMSADTPIAPPISPSLRHLQSSRRTLFRNARAAMRSRDHAL
jgi:hypothetical protein